jgi:hypothetical protein
MGNWLNTNCINVGDYALGDPATVIARVYQWATGNPDGINHLQATGRAIGNATCLRLSRRLAYRHRHQGAA